MCQAGLHAAAARPGGAELRLLRLHGLPATPRRLMPAMWRHLRHRSLWVLQGVYPFLHPFVTKNPLCSPATWCHLSPCGFGGAPRWVQLSSPCPRCIAVVGLVYAQAASSWMKPSGELSVYVSGMRWLQGLKQVSACAAEGAGGSAIP